MSKLTKQFLFKMSPELEELINKSFCEYLKQSGIPTTKAEFIRNILEEKCKECLGIK